MIPRIQVILRIADDRDDVDSTWITFENSGGASDFPGELVEAARHLGLRWLVQNQAAQF